VHVPGEQVGERQARVGEAVLAAQPGLLHREVQAVLPAEVVGHEVLADPGPLGDVPHPGAGEALGGELFQGGIEQRGPGPVGVDLALAGRGGAAGRGPGVARGRHESILVD
jgi:hypothetical protein